MNKTSSNKELICEKTIQEKKNRRLKRTICLFILIFLFLYTTIPMIISVWENNSFSPSTDEWGSRDKITMYTVGDANIGYEIVFNDDSDSELGICFINPTLENEENLLYAFKNTDNKIINARGSKKTYFYFNNKGEIYSSDGIYNDGYEYDKLINEDGSSQMIKFEIKYEDYTNVFEYKKQSKLKENTNKNEEFKKYDRWSNTKNNIIRLK